MAGSEAGSRPARRLEPPPWGTGFRRPGLSRLLLVAEPLRGVTMSANQMHRFRPRPPLRVLRTGCALVAAAQLIGVPVAAMPPDISLLLTPADAAPGGTLTATWAGITATTASDVLGLYTLGSQGGASEAVASWPTGGTAEGTLALALPAWLPLGTYDLRLLSPDPKYDNQLTAIARSEPIRVGGSTTQPTITTTTLPCTTGRCILESSVASPACAGDVVPSSVTSKLNGATTLIEAAATSPVKQAGRVLRRARKLLRSAKASTYHAASGRNPKMSSECATVLEDAVERVLTNLQDMPGQLSGILA